MVDLGKEHHISIEDLIERIIRALQRGEPFGLTRWADSSNWVMSHGRDQAQVLQYREGYMTRRYYEEFRAAFLTGVKAADVLGVFVDDVETKAVMDSLGLDIAGKPLIYPWCNKHVWSRRECVEWVFERPWRTALVGNQMPEYAEWLHERFPLLRIVHLERAQDWPEVKTAMKRFEQTRPQLAILCAGWYTSPLMGAAKKAGVVALSMGHMPTAHMVGRFPPNTDFPRGPEGTRAHHEAHFPKGWVDQEREIVVETT